MTATIRRWLRRLANLLRPARAEDELSRELASHLGLLEDEFRRRGMAEGQARRAAALALGGVEQAKELHRAERSFLWLEELRRDVSHGLRLLRRSPIMASTAALSLAIGIGADASVFTVANALLFRAPTAVREPERLVDIGIGRQDGGFNPGSYPTYLDIRRRAATLDGVYAHPMFPQALSLTVAGDSTPAERVFGHFVTTNYFTVLGTAASRGRLFVPADGEQPGSSPFVVLSDRFWRRRFGGDPAVIGSVIRVNGHPFTVIGVAQDGFQGTGILAPDVWLPLNMTAVVNSQNQAIFEARAAGWLLMGGRLKRDSRLDQAAADLDVIARDLRREHPEQTGARELRVLPSSTVPGNRGPVTAFAVLLTALVSLVLLVACANVAGVLLARAAARCREMAVRLSTGASPARLVRQLLVETIVLFLLGGLAGVALARAMTSLVVARLPPLPFPISVSLAPDGRVLAFTIGLSLIAALAFGLAPALQASRQDPVTALKDESPGATGRGRLRQAFVLAQVAASVALVVGAGLFTRALKRAGSIHPGFDPHGVELVSLDVSMAGYSDATGPRFWRDLVDRVRELPSVQDATVARVLPGGFEGIGLGLSPAGGRSGGATDSFEPDGNIVEPGYFATLRIPLLAGRDFTTADRAGAQPVAIVGEAVARHFWPGENGLGKYLSQPGHKQPLLVVGVARDVKSTSLVDGLSDSFVYLPLQQQYASHLTSQMTIAARTNPGQHATDAIRALVARMNPNLPIVTSRTLEDSVALGLAPQRVAASVASSLGLVALLLAATGIYGVTAFTVARRTREFGIRVALGAERRHVVRMVLRQGFGLIAGGCAVGLSLGAGAGHVLRGFLFGVPPLDPAVLVGAAASSVAFGLAACYGPARRATAVDPVRALRSE